LIAPSLALSAQKAKKPTLLRTEKSRLSGQLPDSAQLLPISAPQWRQREQNHASTAENLVNKKMW
jgi:hypothetical protein